MTPEFFTSGSAALVLAAVLVAKEGVVLARVAVSRIHDRRNGNGRDHRDRLPLELARLTESVNNATAEVGRLRTEQSALHERVNDLSQKLGERVAVLEERSKR